MLDNKLLSICQRVNGVDALLTIDNLAFTRRSRAFSLFRATNSPKTLIFQKEILSLYDV